MIDRCSHHSLYLIYLDLILFVIFRFDVIQPPKYGRIERLRSNGRWVTTKRFFNRQLEKGKLRYRQVKSNPSADYFRFVASVPGSDIVSGPNSQLNDPNISTEKEHIFQIKIISNTIRERRANAIRLINIRETVITDTHLMYQTYPHESPDSAFRYSIVSPPKFGVLLLSTSGQDLSTSSPSGGTSDILGMDIRPKELSIDSEFSQLDLLAGHLKYRLSKHFTKPIDDSFTFRVATEDQTSSVQAFRIHHVPGDTDVDITLERLEVEEGAKRIISKKYLFIRASDMRHFVFNVTRSPVHGNIDILSTNKIDVDRANATYFTLNEIEEERVLYKHDDSESRRDTFHFIATAASSTSSSGGMFRNRHINGFQYVAVFHIAVVLRNDQTPTRVMDKVFEVVEGGQKLLTDQDLLFIDLDIDTKPEDLRYEHRAIPNGELVRVDNPSEPVFVFTQADLNNQNILFRHIGANFGRIMFWINDGQYYVSTELKVKASTPFVKIVNNTGMIIQHGDSAFLSPSNLSVVTNLNAFGDDIKFRIKGEPKYGEMMKDDVPIKTFTEADLRSECIEYRHNGSFVRSTEDAIQFSVVVLERSYMNNPHDVGLSAKRHKAKTEGTLTLRIYPEVYWEPLVVVSNNSLLVDEATSIALTEYDLQIATPSEMSPSDIIYVVRQAPMYGYLEIDPPLNIDELPIQDDNHLILSSSPTKLTMSNQLVSNLDGGVSLFDQSVINEGRLHYIQAISNQTSDHFMFDVTNGISELKDLVFHFTILPKTLYVETRELVATEGGEATLTTQNLHVITDYYVDKIEDYLIVDPPTSGRLVATSNSYENGGDANMHVTESAVAIFSVDDLLERRIRVREVSLC